MPTPEPDVEVLPRGSGPGRASEWMRHATTASGQPIDPLLAFIAKLLDSVFRIPGTNIRFGLDPLIGLIPGMGSPIASAASLFLIARSASYRVPRLILVKMALNVVINAILDAIPIIGGPLSVFYRSNAKNYDLLRKHAGTASGVTRADKAFVFGVLALLILVVGSILFIAGLVVVKGVKALMQ